MLIRASIALLVPAITMADDRPPGARPKPVPETRADVKRALEDSKDAEPRLPLPPLGEEETEVASRGGWGVVNNGRMRRHYLPGGFAGGGFPAREEPGMTLGYPFQTMVFWIVSRANNCTYCLGHQESKLASAGVPEDRVASLDGDWGPFSPADRAAFAFSRKLTTAPHEVESADIDALRSFYDAGQIAELLYVVSSFNAMNRWTGALNIPQEPHREYLTPTAPPFAGLVSRVAPLPPTRRPGTPTIAAPWDRPKLEPRAEVEQRLSGCRDRSPRVQLVSAEETRQRMPTTLLGAGDPPQWIRLLAHFPGVGADRAEILRAVERDGTLDPLLRARACWVAARHDRAWYALEHSRRRLRDLGQSDDEIFALDESPDRLPQADRLALAFARLLTVDPALVTDADVARLREHFSDHQVAELIAVVAEAAFFNRLTEAAGLAWE
jgi:alkylhydroperoxidase family enzyme